MAKNVEVFGEIYTHDLLYNERTKNESQKHITFVISLICDYLSISIEQVILQKGREQNKRILAIKLISYYSYEHFKAFGVTFNDIGNRLKRRHSLIVKYHSSVLQNRLDRTIENSYNQKIYKHFDSELSKYLKNNKHTKIRK